MPVCRLAAFPVLHRSYRAIWLFLCFVWPGHVAGLVGSVCLPLSFSACLLFFCLFLFLLLSPSLLGCAPLLVPVRWWPVVCCFCVSRDQGSPLVLSELPTACRLPGPAPKAVVPARFVVFVFHVTRPRRLPGGQCWPPLVFGFFCFISCPFFSFSFRVCSPARVCARVTSGWLFVCFTRPGLSPCAF